MQELKGELAASGMHEVELSVAEPIFPGYSREFSASRTTLPSGSTRREPKG